MKDGTAIIIFVSFIVCMTIEFIVGDKVAQMIEKKMWGEPYHWSGKRTTIRHYLAIIACIVLAVLVYEASKSTALTIAVFAIGSFAVYVICRLIQDSLGKGAQKVSDKMKESWDKRKAEKAANKTEE